MRDVIGRLIAARYGDDQQGQRDRPRADHQGGGTMRPQRIGVVTAGGDCPG